MFKQLYSTPDDSSISDSVAFQLNLQSNKLKKRNFKDSQNSGADNNNEASLIKEKTGGLVPNRNSFYNGQNALLQMERHMEFSKVASSHSLLGKLSNNREEV